MELCEIDLHELLQSKKPEHIRAISTWSKRIHLLQGIIDGIDYLHMHKIEHRDIKSSNILLDDKSFSNAKITDFGYQKQLLL
jgi:serine/threonine protein kinase